MILMRNLESSGVEGTVLVISTFVGPWLPVGGQTSHVIVLEGPVGRTMEEMRVLPSPITLGKARGRGDARAMTWTEKLEYSPGTLQSKEFAAVVAMEGASAHGHVRSAENV